ncbi:hypothetical protein [Clostridium sp. BSD9I1]|uniref:hypothetical protein n=1 Tax=Clostridium sp. BSD9I1 TaxID=2003589 RepID=UPI001646C3A0|nr:hypothetical protein [Clostridium sp. BSD9I1]
MNNYIADFSSQVHDNEIKSYFIDFDNDILKMNTCWQDKENTTIEFTGLLAHKFENVVNLNIIFGLYQMAIEWFIEAENENLLEALKFGFPSMKAGNCDELMRELKNEKYKVFGLNSSLGLCGYVIAKDIKITINAK